ncbi:MAG TPA: DNA polymerase III subunit chi [Chromatiaceae bacterium]|nr:DNA polymerase III subunit chi [Chromatiaceae bacterium]
MTRVDFYVLAEAARGNRHALACHIIDKAWRQNRRVLVHAGSAEEGRHIDRLLWTFREQSFIPHGLLGKVDAEITPVLIEYGNDTVDEHDVLVNLGVEPAPYFSQFERVAELIDNDPQAREQGRARYRFYRDRGYPLNKHDIR